jgi:ABC-type transporter Mla subunit MlaD
VSAATPRTDRYARRVTIAARVALVLVVVVTVISWVMLGRLATTIERGATLAVDSSASVADISRATATLAQDVADLADAVGAGVVQTDAVLASVIRVAGKSDQALSRDLPTALRGLSATAERVAATGQRLEDLIEALPGDQNLSFGADLRALADGLEPLPATLERLAPDIRDAAAALGELRIDLSNAQAELDQATTGLRAAATEIDRLAAEADRTQAELVAARERVDTQLVWWRVLLVLVAGVVAALAVGLELLGRVLSALPAPAPAAAPADA